MVSILLTPLALCAFAPHSTLPAPLQLRPAAACLRTTPCMMPDKDKKSPTEKIVPIDVQVLQNQLDAVRQLPRLKDKLDRAKDQLVAGMYLDRTEPTFRRLFTHATWERYTGEAPLRRWVRTFLGWGGSSVLRSVWQPVACISLWSVLITLAFPRGITAGFGMGGLFHRDLLIAASGLVLSLQGAAIGLMLVFRTNNAYARLEEAREMWGDIIYLSREVVTKITVALDYKPTCEVCKYLVAVTWSLRDKLRNSSLSDDILKTLIDKEEAAWVCDQRSRPLALLTLIRRVLYDEFLAGKLPSHWHYLLDMDLKEIDHTIASCERLFSSPIPPSMARHGQRSLMIWLMGLPCVLAGMMPAALVALCCISTSYVYMGLDELGAQVEQPFKIMPLWQLCHLAQLNVEESLASPDFMLRLDRKNKQLFPDGVPFG